MGAALAVVPALLLVLAVSPGSVESLAVRAQTTPTTTAPAVTAPPSVDGLRAVPLGKPSRITRPAPDGYTPAQMRRYLGLTGTGQGQTIAIVSAYDAPTVAADLVTFDRTFGLPAPPSFRKVDSAGGTRFPRADPYWALDAAMSVQWAHALAPAASILLVQARTSALADLFEALDYAARQPRVTVISNSFGVDGEFASQGDHDYHCRLSSAVCVFSTGDDGHPGSYPAYNPYVLAVGGTSLTLGANGAPTAERAWEWSGGGVSTLVPKPRYQHSSPYPHRTIPDVSYDADPATGVAVYSSTAVDKEAGWFRMGGTSAAAPQWAAIIAAANSLRWTAGKKPFAAVAGTRFPLHEAVYGAPLYDVRAGSNGSCGAVCTAQPGFDAVSGRGSPRRGIDRALAESP